MHAHASSGITSCHPHQQQLIRTPGNVQYSQQLTEHSGRTWRALKPYKNMRKTAGEHSSKPGRRGGLLDNLEDGPASNEQSSRDRPASPSSSRNLSQGGPREGPDPSGQALDDSKAWTAGADDGYFGGSSHSMSSGQIDPSSDACSRITPAVDSQRRYGSAAQRLTSMQDASRIVSSQDRSQRADVERSAPPPDAEPDAFSSPAAAMTGPEGRRRYGKRSPRANHSTIKGAPLFRNLQGGSADAVQQSSSRQRQPDGGAGSSRSPDMNVPSSSLAAAAADDGQLMSLRDFRLQDARSGGAAPARDGPQPSGLQMPYTSGTRDQQREGTRPRWKASSAARACGSSLDAQSTAEADTGPGTRADAGFETSSSSRSSSNADSQWYVDWGWDSPAGETRAGPSQRPARDGQAAASSSNASSMGSGRGSAGRPVPTQMDPSTQQPRSSNGRKWWQGFGSQKRSASAFGRETRPGDEAVEEPGSEEDIWESPDDWEPTEATAAPDITRLEPAELVRAQ